MFTVSSYYSSTHSSQDLLVITSKTKQLKNLLPKQKDDGCWSQR